MPRHQPIPLPQMESQPRVTCFGLRRKRNDPAPRAWPQLSQSEETYEPVKPNKNFTGTVSPQTPTLPCCKFRLLLVPADIGVLKLRVMTTFLSSARTLYYLESSFLGLYTESMFQKPSTTCGASELLQALVRDPKAKHLEHQSGEVAQGGPTLDRPKAGEGKAEDITLTPKIMASYESISMPSQTNTQSDVIANSHPEDLTGLNGDSVRDRDRDEGADSIVVDE